MPRRQVAPIAEELIDTLHAKKDVLDELHLLFSRQLEALRAGEPALVGEMATKTQERATALDELRETCKRQMRLLSRITGGDDDDLSLQQLVDVLETRSEPEVAERLDEARAEVQARADEVNERSETVNYALEFAAGLNHELLVAMQEAAGEMDAQTYTATGASEAASTERSFVNTVG